jgi:hypothetical protein
MNSVLQQCIVGYAIGIVYRGSKAVSGRGHTNYDKGALLTACGLSRVSSFWAWLIKALDSRLDNSGFYRAFYTFFS